MIRGLFVLAGLGLAVTAAVSAAPERTWQAPASADARVNPLAGRGNLAAGGRRIFAERCASCHGSDASGTRRGPNLTTGPVLRQSDGALFWKITNGNTRSGMPTFSFLPEPQRWQLVNHLRAEAGR